jgi:hypothetical protein
MSPLRRGTIKYTTVRNLSPATERGMRSETAGSKHAHQGQDLTGRQG